MFSPFFGRKHQSKSHQIANKLREHARQPDKIDEVHIQLPVGQVFRDTSNQMAQRGQTVAAFTATVFKLTKAVNALRPGRY